MHNTPTHDQSHVAESGGFEGESISTSAAPPAFQLLATPIQRTEDEATPAEPGPIAAELIRLWAEEDKAPFWEYVHGHRAEIGGDAEATAWVDENLSHVENWRADTIVEQGAVTAWTDARKLELATWVRSQFPAIEDIRTYIDNEYISDDLKLQTLGQLRSTIGQAEYLLGSIFHGGNTSWETNGANNGQFVNDYHNTTGFTWAHDAWCTMFTGYLHAVTGFRTDVITRDGAFWSNYRLDVWQNQGIRSNGNAATADPQDYENYSGSAIQHSAFQSLYDSLVTHHGATWESDEAKSADMSRIFTEFYGTEVTPQAGDTIVMNNAKGRNNTARDHTVMVESYDAASHTINTVEGNSSDRVRGRQIRMEEDPRNGPSTNVGNLYLLVRAGLEFFRDPNAEAEEAAPEAAEGAEGETEGLAGIMANAAGAIRGVAEGIALLAPMNSIVSDLRNMAQGEGLVGAGTTVAAMSNPNNTAGTTR